MASPRDVFSSSQFAPGPSLVWTPWRCPVCDAMGLWLPILLLLLCCVSGLPFYNGFYYSNHPNGRKLGNAQVP